jgi:hypothetical protein
VEGYFAGLHYDEEGNPAPDFNEGTLRQKMIRGSVFMAGVHNLWWPKSLSDAWKSPVTDVVDYYRSNYELEALARVKILYQFLPSSWVFPSSEIKWITNFSFDDIPLIGGMIDSLYKKVINGIANNPFMNSFYRVSNTEPDTMQYYLQDGMEDIPIPVLEQLGHAVLFHETESYYHLKRSYSIYQYKEVRPKLQIPIFFIAGGHDRMASPEMIFKDGYSMTASLDKTWLAVPESGHEDLIFGKNAIQEVMIPIAQWFQDHTH